MTLALDQRDFNLVAIQVNIIRQQYIGLNSVIGIEACRQDESLVWMKYFILVIEPKFFAQRLFFVTTSCGKTRLGPIRSIFDR